MAEKRHFSLQKFSLRVSGVEKWGEIEVSGGLRKIGDFIGLNAQQRLEGTFPKV